MQAEIVESFEIKDEVAIEYGASGTVVIFSPLDPDDLPTEGEPVFIIKPDGSMRLAVIGEVKFIPDRPGFFIPNLKVDAVPKGTRLRWGQDLDRRTARFQAAAFRT